MAALTDTMTEKLGSFGSVLKQKMKEIYEHHQKLSQGIEDQADKVQKENSKLQSLNERLTNEVDLLRERLHGLEVDNKRLSGELVNTSTRLSAPCENCKSLMQQLEQQNKLVYTLMEKQDLSINTLLEKYLKSSSERQVLIDKTADAKTTPSILNVLSQALQSSVTKYDELLQNPQIYKSSQSHFLIPVQNNIKKETDSSNSTFHQNDANQECKRTGNETEDHGETKCEVSPCGSDKISPTNKKLKLNRAGKRTRHKYIEEYIPDSKRKRTLTATAVASNSRERNLGTIEKSEDHKILVADTCNLSVDTPKNLKKVTRDACRTKKRDINSGPKQSILLVPETVPMDMPDSDEICYSEVTEKQSNINNRKRNLNANETDQHTKFKDVNHLLSSVLFSPPSHSSTPLPVSPETSTDKLDTNGSFLVQKESSNQDNTPSSSPVFGKSNSPPLFDESTCISDSLKDKNLSVEIHDFNHKSNKKSKERRKSVAVKDKSCNNKSFYLENNQSLSGNESSLLLSKPTSVKNNTQSPGRESKIPISSQRCRMSPLNFSIERAGEAKIKSPEVNKSPSVLSGKVKGIVTSPNVNTKLLKTKNGKIVHEPNMKKIKAKYFQTKLSSEAFKSKKKNKSRMKEYNGKADGSDVDSLTQQEEHLLEQVKISSLQDNNLPESAKECTKADIVTSTPAVKSQKPAPVPDVSVIDHENESELVFKIPVPPSTPKSVKYENFDVEVLRRSPRFKNKVHEDGQNTRKFACDLNGTVDPNVNLAEFDSSGTVQSRYLDKVSENTAEDRIQNEIKTQGYMISLRHKHDRVTRAKLKASQEDLRVPDAKIDQISKRRQSQRSKRSVHIYDLYDNQETDMSEKSAVFGAVSPTRISYNQNKSQCTVDINSSLQLHKKNNPTAATLENIKSNPCDSDNSFDRLPEQVNEKGYKYVTVVRKKEERAKLDTYVCIECDKWFNGMGLSDEEKRQRMKAGCKHKALFAPPDTPEHYWSVGFPDTQQCKERGYMNTTQAKPSKYRRQKPLRQLFKANTDTINREEEAASDFSD